MSGKTQKGKGEMIMKEKRGRRARLGLGLGQNLANLFQRSTIWMLTMTREKTLA
jgi:hypothetical protein